MRTQVDPNRPQSFALETVRPTNPLLGNGEFDIEYTCNAVNDVLKTMSVFLWGLAEIENHSILNNHDHLAGAEKSVREAVDYINAETFRQRREANVSQMPSGD